MSDHRPIDAQHPQAALAELRPEDPAPDLSGDTEMRRLHPLTPVLKSWVVVAAGIGYLWTQVTNLVEGRLFGASPGGDDLPIPIWSALFLVALVGALTYGYLYWRFTRYGIVNNVLRVHTGVLFRQSRQVALDRLQAVDLVRPIAARIAGLAELRLEVAGGGSSEAPLAYLSLPDARRLRAELLARAAGLDAQTPEAPERPVLRVPTGQLLLGSLLSGATLTFIGIGAGLGITVVVSGETGFLLPFLPALIGAAVTAARRFSNNYAFTIAESPDGVRISKGLLDTRAQTVPPGRVQAVRVSQPLLWRSMDLVHLDVNVAGYAASSDRETEQTSVLLPVGERREADSVLHRVLPGVDPSTVRMMPVPPRARVLRPVGWRYLAAGTGESIFVVREGWMRRDLVVMPHAKPQSIRMTQGPLQRRLNLASVHLDSTRGPVAITARHRDAREARAIVDDEVVRERAARRSARPDRWESRTLPEPPQYARQPDSYGLYQPPEAAEPGRIEDFRRPPDGTQLG